MKEIFFGTNAIAAFCGWVAWTVIMLSVYKDDNEKIFNLKAYAQEHWDNWLASLVSIPVLLYLGFVQFNFGTVLDGGSAWNDAYYVGSGFFVEVVKMAWKKWKTKNG